LALSRVSARGGPSRRVTLRRCGPGELVLPQGIKDSSLVLGEAKLGAYGRRASRMVASRCHIQAAAGAGERQGVSEVRQVGVIQHGATDAVAVVASLLRGAGDPWAVTTRLVTSRKSDTTHRAVACHRIHAAGFGRLEVVLGSLHNCRSRWTARGPSAPVNSRLGGWT
jgi:hypothetical protein